MINTNFGISSADRNPGQTCRRGRARPARACLSDGSAGRWSRRLAIFDKDDRLVLWNRQYPKLYASNAEAIVQGARFDDILRAA
jgi:hypothetical protein